MVGSSGVAPVVSAVPSSLAGLGFFDVAERIAASAGRKPGRYLETPTDSVNARVSPLWTGFYRLRSKPCRCKFCDRCCRPIGFRVRERLTSRLREFASPYTATLTIDRDLFAGPEEAYDYLRLERCVARLVKDLWEASSLGLLDENGRRLCRMNGRAFFYSLEWQSGGWAHFHLVLDADFIAFDLIAAMWARSRPEWCAETPYQVRAREAVAALRAERVEARKAARKAKVKPLPSVRVKKGDRILCELAAHRAGKTVDGAERPTFGSVRFTKDDEASRGSAEKAAYYASKYLTKPPEGGIPAWVDERTRVRSYSTSKGFWGVEGEPAEPDDDGACPACGGDGATCDCCTWVDETHITGQRPLTIRERRERCGVATEVMAVHENVNTLTGELVETVRRLGTVPMTLAEACAVIGVQASQRYRVDLVSGTPIRRLYDREAPSEAEMEMFRLLNTLSPDPDPEPQPEPDPTPAMLDDCDFWAPKTEWVWEFPRWVQTSVSRNPQSESALTH